MEGSVYGLSNDTWNTGCILKDSGRFSLYDVLEILCTMVKGPTNLGVSFLEVLTLRKVG